MTIQNFIHFFFTILFLLTTYTTTTITAFPNGFHIQSAGGERAMGYNSRPTGPRTLKPTWRPKNKDLAPLPSNDLEADAHFSDDYYDDYDGDIEGTQRNIFLYHSFEDRMKIYIHLIQQQAKANQIIKAAKAAIAARKKAAVEAAVAAAVAAAAAKKKLASLKQPIEKEAHYQVKPILNLGILGLR